MRRGVPLLTVTTLRPGLITASFPGDRPPGTRVIDVRVVGPKGESAFRVAGLSEPPDRRAAPTSPPRSARLWGFRAPGRSVVVVSFRPLPRTVYEFTSKEQPSRSGYRSSQKLGTFDGRETSLVLTREDVCERGRGRIVGAVEAWRITAEGSRPTPEMLRPLFAPGTVVEVGTERNGWRTLADPRAETSREAETNRGERWRARRSLGEERFAVDLAFRDEIPADLAWTVAERRPGRVRTDNTTIAP